MIGSVSTSNLSAYLPRTGAVEHSDAISRQKQPDLMPMRRPGEEVVSERAPEEPKKEIKKDPEFLLHHTRATLEERMKQVLSEHDIKMLLYMTAPLPRTEDTMAQPGQLFDVFG